MEKTLNLFNELIKLYEKTETFNILCYSSDQGRDFRLLEAKVVEYKERLNEIIATDGCSDSREDRVSSGKEDIQN